MTDYGPRAERWVAEKWPAIRAGGLWRFVLLKGVAFWGGLMFAFMTLVMAVQLGIAHPRLLLVIAVAVPLCAMGGLVWACSPGISTSASSVRSNNNAEGIA